MRELPVLQTSGGVGIADSMQEDGCHDNLVLAVRSLGMF